MFAVIFGRPGCPYCGKPVETVPQIFLDQKHIGGCTDFEAYAKEHLGLFAAQ